MSVDDVIKENMTAADAGAAFVANRVDAAVTWEPWLTRGKATDHGKVLVDTSSTPGVIIDVLAFRSDVVKTRGDDIRKIIRRTTVLSSSTSQIRKRPPRSWPDSRVVGWLIRPNLLAC